MTLTAVSDQPAAAPDRQIAASAVNAGREKVVVAVPKGRILKEVLPLFARCGIEPEPAFADEDSRALRFRTSDPDVDLIRVRSFDVATFVAFGGAQVGVCGADVLLEFGYEDVYTPVDLGIGRCHLAVAARPEVIAAEDPARWSHIRVATKYPNVSRRFFSQRGVQAECVKLNGALELAPQLGLCRRIVDLVSTGATLRANGLKEIEKIADITSRLAVNRPALKTRSGELRDIIRRFETAIGG